MKTSQQIKLGDRGTWRDIDSNGKKRYRELNLELKIPAPSAGKTLIKKGGIAYTASPYWNPAKVTSVIQHAVLAEPEELPSLPTITTAAIILQQRLSNQPIA